MTWDPSGGTTSVYDVVRGFVRQLPVGTGADEVCVASGIAQTMAFDGTPSVNENGFWYDVRGRHACGVGPYGTRSDGTPHTPSVCP